MNDAGPNVWRSLAEGAGRAAWRRRSTGRCCIGAMAAAILWIGFVGPAEARAPNAPANGAAEAAIVSDGAPGGADGLRPKVDPAAGDPAAGDRPEAKREWSEMALWQAAVLGVVEGLTEYLPVSSTGHLLVTQDLMGLGGAGEEDKAAADAYAICIQAGAIVAVLGLYWRRVGQAFRGFAGDKLGRRLQANLLAGFVPAAVLGLALNDVIKSHLFGPWPVVAAWFVGGAVILAVVYRRKLRGATPRSGVSLDELTWKLALLIGFAQCIAMWPGVSRSLITIVGGVLVGLSLPAAVEFSFLLGVVTLGAATAYDAMKHGPLMAEAYSPLALIVGMAFAFASAAVAVKWMVAYLNKHSMAIFGFYRVAIAVLVAILIVAGVLNA